jgi:hypothetical protein
MEDPGNNQLNVATGDRPSTVELITHDPWVAPQMPRNRPYHDLGR